MKLKKRKPQVIYCAICIYVRINKEAEEAITIKGGTAVCYDHLEYGHDPNVTNALIYLRGNMPSGMFVCELCKTAGKDFRTPNDEIGAALMEQHLISEHHLDPNFKGYNERSSN